MIEVSKAAGEWEGPTPFFLVVEPPEGVGNIGIDLDTPGWISANQQVFRMAATWWLYSKTTMQPVMAQVVAEGDQPYFTKHHVGNLMSGREIIVYGMGRKKADGSTVNLWLVPSPTGAIFCGGDDADILASRIMG